MEKGKIYVIGTPIGNLKDITLRAIETLNIVDFIVCEDTRITQNILKEFSIKKKLVSMNARTELKKMDFLLDRLNNGESFALLSDAGTPCISDPGIRLVNEAKNRGFDVVGLPGANAAILALSIAGLPTNSFVFEGFLPQKKGRQKKLKELSKEERTIVIYESPYRIEKLLRELTEFMPDRMVVAARELTKKFEELWKGHPEELLLDLINRKIKGEFVIIIGPLNWVDKMSISDPDKS